MRPHKEPCGCKSTDREWREFCTKHGAEFRELHELAQRDYRRQEDERAQKRKP